MEDGEIAITIEDDGAGFDAAALGGRGGLGLSGIAERARILGGRSAIRSSPGQGTTVSVHLPRKSGEEIAEELTVHYRTVENHRTSMAGKLGLVGSHALSRYAAQHRDRLN